MGITGDARDQLEAVGDGVDPVCLVSCLRKKLGHAQIIKVEEVKKPEEKKKPEQQKPQRVASLDVFRGLTVAVSRTLTSSALPTGLYVSLLIRVPIVFACA